MAGRRSQGPALWWPLILGAGALAAMAPLFSCAPDSGFNTIQDYDVVATHYDPKTDFSSLRTYSMPDTLIHRRDPEDASSVNLSREHDQLVLTLVRDNLEDLGYEEEADPGSNRPDVYVIVSATLTEWLANASEDWWDYWGWYPHWPPSWGPGWGTYYPFPINYFYRAGTVFIDMIDDEVPAGEEQIIPILWTASINGIMLDTSSGAEDRLTANIRQAFDQSPYLATD
jgi:hypothetical protein